ncbi:MAG TPA: SDR family NAD(P)-dependent oxidoreductase [Allosphingosinicella sp.]|nr:SDR family NAD(P)-dependent oxidoreductase [Allosphingosinicella sp.]
MKDFAGKAAVVTGAASGIGLAVARALMEAGSQVLLSDVEPAALAEAAAALGAPCQPADVRSAAQVEALAAAAMARFGRVDIVVNNAGIGPFGALDGLGLDDWHWMLDVNLWGAIHGVRAFLPLLERNPDGGHIVNTGSMSSLAAMPMLGAYAVAKYGVAALTEALAAELAHKGSKVCASLLCPGPVRTRIGTSTRNRPPGMTGSGLADMALETLDPAAAGSLPWLDPEAVATILLEGIGAGDLYILTHPELFGRVEARFEALRTAARIAERRRAALR